MRSEVWSNQFKHQVNMVLPELRSFKLFKLISSAWDRSDYKMIRLGKIWQRNRQKGVNWVLVTAHRDQALIGSWNVYFLSDLTDMWGKLEVISLQNTAYIWSENKTSNYWEGRTEDQLSCLCLVPEYEREREKHQHCFLIQISFLCFFDYHICKYIISHFVTKQNRNNCIGGTNYKAWETDTTKNCYPL